MKQRLFAALLAALLVFTMIPFAFAQTVTATEPTNVAYLDETNGDDGSANLNDSGAPFGTFSEAYNALCPEGGTLQIVDAYGTVHKENINGLSVHYGMITIKGNTASAIWSLPATDTTAASIKNYVIFGGPVTIQEITLNANQQIDLFANYNKLTMGEGIVCQPATARISVLGGSRHEFGDGDMDCDFFEDTWITIKSGVYRTVAGGCRVLANNNTKTGGSAARRALLGTAYIFFEGGTASYLFGTNWAQSTAVDSSAGGGAYVYVSGGIINNFYFGAQNAQQFSFSDNFLIYTGGHIVGINYTGNVYTGGRALAFYGGSITSDYAYSQVGSGQKNSTVFTNSDTSETTVFKNLQTGIGMQVLPLRTYDPDTTQTVYVGDIDFCKAGNEYGLPTATSKSRGTEDDPIYSLTAAYVYLTFSGGEIVVLGPRYTLKNYELTGAYRYNEPYHEKKITVKGNGYNSEQTKLQGVAIGQTRTKAGSGGQSYSMPCGFDIYNLCGDTEFKDIKLSFDSYRSNIAANFHDLVIGDNVSTSRSVCLCGGTVGQIKTIVTPYAGGADHTSASDVSFYGPYSRWSDADTHITLSATNTGTWWITGFSRVNGSVLLPAGDYLSYPGTAHVTINGGTIECLYPAPTNKANATGANAVIAINGGTVKELYDGGYDLGNGAIANSLDITVGENATVEKYLNRNNTTPAAFTMKVNSTYSSYLLAKNTYTQATVTTDMTAETYNDAIDMTLGFGLKDNGENGVKIRYGVVLKDYVIDDENFTVKEFGILVKKADNAAALEWFESNEQLTYHDKVAKSVAFLRGSSIRYYFYYPDDPEKNPNDVEYYANLSGIDEERYQTDYVFRPYMVVTVGGEDRIVYGEAVTDSAYGIASRNGSTNEAAVKVLTAVNG